MAKVRYTQEEKELNVLVRKLWWDKHEINRLMKEGDPKKRRRLEDVRKSFNKTAEEIKKKFRAGRKDGKVIVIFERYTSTGAPDDPIAVLRQIEVEDGLMKVTVSGRKYIVEPTSIEDYKKIVSFPVFKAVRLMTF